MALKVVEETNERLLIEVTSLKSKLLGIAIIALGIFAGIVLFERGSLECDRGSGQCAVSRIKIGGVERQAFLLSELRGVEVAVVERSSPKIRHRVEFVTARGTIPLTEQGSRLEFFERRKARELRALIADRSQSSIKISHGPGVERVFITLFFLGGGLFFVLTAMDGMILLDARQNKLSFKLVGLVGGRDEDFMLDRVEGLGRRGTVLDAGFSAERPSELCFLMRVGPDIPFVEGHVFTSEEEAEWVYRIRRFLKEMPPPLVDEEAAKESGAGAQEQNSEPNSW